MNLPDRSSRRASFQFLYVTALANVLLIFFLFLSLPAVISVPSGISINWPKNGTGGIGARERFVVTLGRDRVLYVQSTKVTLEEFERGLEVSPMGNRTVLIKADAKAQIGTLVRIWSALRRAGAETIHIATNE